MSPSRRSERRRKRSATKRAEALARLPRMLAEEEALRKKVITLNRRASRLPEHLEYDRQISDLVSRAQQMEEALPSAVNELMNYFGRIMLDKERTECAKARAQLETLESLNQEYEEIVAKVAELSAARADLGVVPVDRVEMASKIDLMAKRLEHRSDVLRRNRAMFDSLCPPDKPKR